MNPNETNFNMALPTLDRIDNLLKNLALSNISGNYFYNKKLLRELYKEVYPFLGSTEKTKAANQWELINKFGFQKTSRCGYNVDSTVIEHMDNLDFWLRQKLKDKGLLMPKSDYTGVAMGRSGF